MAKDPKTGKKNSPEGDPSGAPTPPKSGNAEGELDLSKLSDEQINKVLEDPRIWKTERLSKLREDSKELTKRKDADEEAEKKALEKKGEFEELQKKTQKKLDDALKRADDAVINNQIIAEANKKGIKDADAATKLIDRSKIKKDDDGNITGVEEAIDSLVESKPYLKTGPVKVGSPTGPGETGAGEGKFTITQIQDSKFFQENREEILKAQADGNIVDDRQTISPTVAPVSTPDK